MTLACVHVPAGKFYFNEFYRWVDQTPSFTRWLDSLTNLCPPPPPPPPAPRAPPSLSRFCPARSRLRLESSTYLYDACHMIRTRHSPLRWMESILEYEDTPGAGPAEHSLEAGPRHTHTSSATVYVPTSRDELQCLRGILSSQNPSTQ